jgi:hypothetical protein
MSLARVPEFPTPGEAVPSGFVHLPHAVLTDTQLSAAQRVYWAIVAGHASKERSCYPGEERLARLVGCTARQIRTYNTALVARGLLMVEPRKGTSNLYRLPVTPATEGSFTRVSRKVLYDATLSVGARLAYAVVVYYQRQDDACLHSDSAMAKLAGTSARTMEHYLADLRAVGLIEVTRHTREAAGRHATITAGKKSTRPQRTSLRRDKKPKQSQRETSLDPSCTSGVEPTRTSGVDPSRTSAEVNPSERNPSTATTD